MFNLKKQINTLYITGLLGRLSLTGAWVVILASRGFSLVQIGFAETVFHITSLIMEIPSGMLADMYGRKKMLVLGNLMLIIGDMIMFFSRDFWMVLLSMPFHAMSYNFASGSGEALAYDSMKMQGAQEGYEKYVSNQFIIYRIGSGISTLGAGLALYLGYRKAYLLSAAVGCVTLCFTLTLFEIKGSERWKHASVFREIISHFTESIRFMGKNGKAAVWMFLNSFVGAVDILLLFFLQSKLKMAGISNSLLGPVLFVMELGGIVGARLILKAKKTRYIKVFVVCTAGVFAGVLLEHTGVVALMVLGGFISAMADDAIEIRTEAKLQDMFPSEQRATLVSLSSFTFSVIMIVLSPIAGYFFSIW